MKTNIPLKHIALIGVLAIVGLVATQVTAWQAPSAAPTGGNVAAPLNTGAVAQTKNNSINTTQSFIAQNGVSAVKSIRATGTAIQNLPNTPTDNGSVIGRKLCLAGTLGAALLGIPGATDANSQALDCIDDWSDVGGGLPPGTNGSILTWYDGAQGGPSWIVSNDILKLKGGMFGTNPISGNGKYVEIAGGTLSTPARQDVTLDVNGRVKISGGNPGPGKVLTAKEGIDHTLPANAGQAEWTDLSDNMQIFYQQKQGINLTGIAYCGINEINGQNATTPNQDWLNNGRALSGSVSCFNTGGNAFQGQVIKSYPASVGPGTSGQTVPQLSFPQQGGLVYNGWAGQCGQGTGAEAANTFMLITVTCVK